MTLEDFFTLTEMKNGLATLGRVEELISIMQQKKDSAMSTVSDSARQWSSVASTLAATENKDCLNHFVKLNGLCCLNQWLQESLKFGNDIADRAVEELLIALLGSLEKLPISREDSVASGIQFTVEQLVGFKFVNIEKKASALTERWKNAAENGVTDQDINKDEKCEHANLKPPSDVATVDYVNLAHPVVDNATRRGQEECNCRAESAGIGCPSQIGNTDDTLTSKTNQIMPASSSNSAVASSNTEDMDPLPPALVPNSSEANDFSLNPIVEVTSSVTFCSKADDHCIASVLKDENPKDMKIDVDTKGRSPSKLGQTESGNVPTSSGLSVSSHAHKHERSISCNLDAKEIKSYALETAEALPRSASIDCVVPKYLRNLDHKPDMQDLLSVGSKLRTKDDLRKAFESASEAKGKTIAPHENLKPVVKKSIVEMDQRSELALEYGEIDALEVARQVAIEVEREVVDYREPFCCSSPDDNSSSSYNEEQEGKGLDRASTFKDGNLINSVTNIGPSECEQDMGMSKPITRESGEKTEQNRHVFDLNEDVCADEESDCLINCMSNNSVNLTAPIAVAASKGALFLPASRPHFEGELGWKGSAATSAFHAPSPRRTSDANGKTSSGHKRKPDVIDFDLNVVETRDDDARDSAEASSRRADKLKFDLNCLGDEDIPFPHQNGDQTMSSTSSSSSRQHATRDFDLNDSLNFLDAMGSHDVNKLISEASDNPVITIMGSKITKRKGCLNETPQSFTWKPPIHQFPLPAYGYNGPMMGPSMPFPPPFYPYMMDSRGATAAPQIINTAGLNNASSSSSSYIPSFLTSVPNTSRPGLDLNSGFMSAETERRESGNFIKNFFTQGHNGFMEDHMYR